jgi:hypothetical protein
MNTDSGDPNNPPGEPETPVSELREMEHEVSPEFMRKVRGKIHRKTTTNQFMSLTWYLPKVVLVEMAGVLKHVLDTVGGKKESQR